MDVLHADSSILVVNKPAGLATGPGSWGYETSLMKILESDYGRIWVVHRLDKTTSGLVVFARTAESHRDLSMQFEHHQAEKVYHAIVLGRPAWKEHTARQSLRIDVGHSHRTIVDASQGKPSETTFRVLEWFDGYALLAAMPATGRTHQVRVHAGALGLPLLGDTRYGAPATDLIGRPALHARSLMFTHPVTLECLSFTAPYPQDFERVLQALRGKK
jgi:RluA family pseudouridine synthase